MKYHIPVYILFLGLLFTACKVNHLVRVEPNIYAVEPSLNVENDSSILALIAPYKNQLSEEMNEVIGTAELTLDLSSRGRPESLLGNFVADALQAKAEEYSKTNVDFTVVNKSGLRTSSIPEGTIQQSLVFELLPFENILVILELDSKLVRRLVNHMAKNGGWPISQGLYYQITQSGAAEIRINGVALEEGRQYKVAMPDYIANGGDASFFLVNLPQVSTQKLMRTALIEYIKEAPGPISAQMDGRIEIKN